ncbi:MAG: class I SAM-dependent methyltransferase [Pseudomonadota bacterium]
MSEDPSGWQQSAQAWIAHLGDAGDRGRQYILDAPMRAAARDSGAKNALDVGCGEGRFCRMLREDGITATGLDPTPALLEAARSRDPEGTYIEGRGEELPFPDQTFDLVVSYLSLIDIPDYQAAIAEMARVLTKGGTLLVGNLNSFVTAVPRNWPNDTGGWVTAGKTRLFHAMDDYMDERGTRVAWAGIEILNYHRPLSHYMAAFLGAGLSLVHYDEPPYTGPDEDVAAKMHRCPWFNMMIWRKI